MMIRSLANSGYFWFSLCILSLVIMGAYPTGGAVMGLFAFAGFLALCAYQWGAVNFAVAILLCLGFAWLLVHYGYY